ncbi:hypothetical protein M422DRAFT_253135 [Sphaerobolus stellatus SS14]|uniref:CHAT domain-containing protein n=1 Tax=Sphaerobolus stellatus (strain SS14) TaxID=990650 RepID=A0A0C9VNH4_SPHS4|nr:hypothetical protein M422DRAFT_253135 [Sphaerobolus stellatus SS14]
MHESEKKIDEYLSNLIIRGDGKFEGDSTRDGVPLAHPFNSATDQGFKASLAELWELSAKPVLDALTLMNPSPEVKPHIWWCPTGFLSFLPLHAAGLYHSNAPLGSKLSDFVISSYTPTLSAILDRSSPLLPPSTPPTLLAIAPSSFGQSYLPRIADELRHIKQVMEGTLTVKTLIGEDAALENNLAHPTESALLLAGNDRLSLAKLMSLKIAHGDLAFLSACPAAKADEQLSDKAFNLSAGMLVSGYRGVITTMWPVKDQTAPQVVRDVYRHLRQFKLDATEAAHALHLAVQTHKERYCAGRR